MKVLKIHLLIIALTFIAFPKVSAQQSSSSPIIIVDSLEPQSKEQIESDYAGYLLAYFKDQTQSAYLAVSRDGYTFTDLNNGKPLFIGSELAEQKGVRDPHITRGPDGAFYLPMTYIR